MAIDITQKLDEATKAEARTNAAIAAVPTLGNAPVSRSEPSGGALSGPAGGITIAPGMMSADNRAMAAANATRQQMIDAQPKGGIATLGDADADKWNARMEKDAQVQKITDLMARNPNMSSALSGALSQTVAGQAQQEVEQMRQRNNAGIEMAKLGLTARG